MPIASLRHLLIVALAVGLAIPRLARGQAPDDMARLQWLAGCWELRTASRLTHEHWMPPLGGLMLGMSRTVVNGVAREHEALRIAVAAGRLAYIAQPGGQPATTFGATLVSDTLVVFENPGHDFPQRIRYARRAGSDSLTARIEGERGGATRAIAFPMARISCEGAAAAR